MCMIPSQTMMLATITGIQLTGYVCMVGHGPAGGVPRREHLDISSTAVA